jgi:serine/threonine protein phosphatase PrpC
MPAFYSIQVRTHTGSVREINEDAVSTVLDQRETLGLEDKDQRARGHLFAISDGMGGHAAGEVASNLVIDTLFRSYYASESSTVQGSLAQAITDANRVVCAEAQANPAYAGMGATLVAAVLKHDELVIGNVGDSRAYLFRDGGITQITHDHSWVAEQVKAGVLTKEKASHPPYRNVITRSLGPDRDPAPDFFHLQTYPQFTLTPLYNFFNLFISRGV